MTRKDFQIIADVISNMPIVPSKDTIAQEFAKVLKTTNPNFNYDRFMTACLAQSQGRVTTKPQLQVNGR